MEVFFLRKIKTIQTLFLALIMVLGTMSITVSAAEVPETNNEVIASYDFVITPEDNENKEVSLLSTSAVNNTFNVYNSHTGSSRTYSGRYLRYCITITDTNGNPVDNILAVRLYDSSNTLRREDQFWADGGLNIIQNIPINSGTAYYFQYLLAYGTPRTLRVHMEISSYN